MASRKYICNAMKTYIHICEILKVSAMAWKTSDAQFLVDNVVSHEMRIHSILQFIWDLLDIFINVKRN